MSVIISTTAYQSGAGSDRYKYVCGLTPDERERVLKDHALVAFLHTVRSRGLHGTLWRVCKVGRGRRVYPRVPWPGQLRRIERLAEQREAAP
jgi:hypothetical protein